jgi:hypothetical protein
LENRHPAVPRLESDEQVGGCARDANAAELRAHGIDQLPVDFFRRKPELTGCEHQHPLPLREGNQAALLHPVQKLIGVANGVAGEQAAALVFETSAQLDGQIRTQLRVEEQLIDQVGPEPRTSIPPRLIVAVHVGVDLLEARAARHRARRRGSDLRDRNGARLQLEQHPFEGRELEFLFEAAAPRFYQQREVFELTDRLEQLLGAQAAHPQRQSFAELAARHEQRPSGRFAEAGTEEARRFEAPAQVLLEARARYE